ITTLERNAEMVKLAKDNIYKAGYQEFIEVVQMDAVLEAEKLLDKRFDMIFIDAAKAQYIKFFELYAPLLNSNGVIVCDNISFHGLTDNDAVYEEQSRSVKGLIRKMNNFKEYFLSLKDFNTTILPIGDGMAIAVKK
ncbi:MAG: class I SAM-dependent methyltransferase, partial [Anaeroplasmataceae bacterium]|nr:class I SAM-dependent methyltransferase [Anaeroplasmataceae bacterium]